jgi:hypothetical protein
MPLDASKLQIDTYAEELLLSRRILKLEMGKANRAYSPQEKKDLLESWKNQYSKELVNELLRVAKNPEARYRIANWNLEQFSNERRKSK